MIKGLSYMSRKAVQHLRKIDPIMREIIDRVGPCRLKPNHEGTHFDHIVRSIIFQQLSGKAASTIHGRVKGLFGDRHPTPEEIAAAPDELLRAAGVSPQKLKYLKDLALKVMAGEVTLDAVHSMTDEAIIESLMRVKGVGRWTAQMFLMFRLGRADVLPTVDLGINKAVKKAYGLRRMPSPEKLQKIGESWSPYRTFACWYLWRSLD
jgi:3-methyladenine DNA glycosylase/8-oxoguanine DNA glycosylase